MVFQYLAGIIILLIVAHLIVHYTVRRKNYPGQKKTWSASGTTNHTQRGEEYKHDGFETEVTNPNIIVIERKDIGEKDFLD